MTQQEFAEFIGMSPASLSSIFNGRTRPTLNIVEAIKNKIPTISTDWLMFGTGSMYESEGGDAEQSVEENHSSTAASMLDFSAQNDLSSPDLFAETAAQRVPRTTQNHAKNIINIIDKKTRKITEIRIFFDDKTWETFVPKE
uniref:Helix-turn-helix transcriptional regulator n=1 Tax=Prevotella sp. GTC17259 TaxID=3236795 RepID=A0AB33J2T4_9BACT